MLQGLRTDELHYTIKLSKINAINKYIKHCIVITNQLKFIDEM